MAQKDLKTNVIIGGQTTAGFNALASRLESLGAVVEQIGGKVREFEGESVNVYRNYEDNMLAAEYALSAQYTSVTELSKVMEGLNLHASEWAATTIFHTDDVSKAINEAAHAGWNYEEIVKGIPQAMLIAQAGSMDLSQGLDYLIKMTNSTGTSFDNMGTLIDQWAKASNLSATNIGEMGEAFMSLSASAMFADNTQELFTMLAVLADVGVTGSKAGTLIRNAMMRMIAPTDKAKKAMAGLDASEEDLADWKEAGATAKELEKLGFSAYKANGDLKPMRDIMTSLHDAISGMDEQGRYDILSTIFPLRSINAATAFYNAIESGKWDETFTAIGDSEGYAAEGSDIMMSGLTGAIETLASKWEEFQRQIGETLAPVIEKVAGALGTIMDGINSMDESSLSALVGGMTTLAEAGPALLIAGGAIKMFSAMGVWGGVMLAAVGMGALAGYMKSISEINFKENFGTMQLDLDALGTHVDSLGTKFTAQQQAIAAWEQALEQAETEYANKSSALSELLLQDVLEGKTLSQDDITRINDYAGAIYKATMDGIENAQASDKTFLQAMFGDKSTLEEEEAFDTGAKVVDNYYDSLYQEAYAIGEEMRNQMTAALQDSTLDEGERQAIQATIDRLNQINAAIASALDKEAFYEQLYKAQSVSWESASEYMEENARKRQADEAALEDTYAKKWAHYKAAFDYAIENGTEFTDIYGNKRKVNEGDWATFEAQIAREKGESLKSVQDKYDQLNFAALDALMNDSDYASAWKFMRGLTQNENGTFDLTDAFAGMTPEQISQLTQDLSNLSNNGGNIISRLGKAFGEGGLGDYVRAMMTFGAGNASNASMSAMDRLQYMGLGIMPTEAEWAVFNRKSELQAEIDEQRSRIEKLRGQSATLQASIDGSQKWIEEKGGTIWDGLIGTTQGNLDNIQKKTAEKNEVDLDIEEAEKDLAALEEQLANLEEERNVELNGEDALTTVGVIAEAITGLSLLNPIVTFLRESGDIDGYDPPNFERTVTYHIQTTGGIGGAISNAVGAVGNFLGGLFAEGGRADTPSIFAEAGAEWAIPEEHSQRTAELLNAARQASGFTWGDLISRYGGLNANPGNRNVVLHYSPTINAGNAEGVAAVLQEDKRRIMKMVRQALDEDRMRNEVEVYA